MILHVDVVHLVFQADNMEDEEGSVDRTTDSGTHDIASMEVLVIHHCESNTLVTGTHLRIYKNCF